MERPKLHNRAQWAPAIANLNTLAYVVSNLRILRRLHDTSRHAICSSRLPFSTLSSWPSQDRCRGCHNPDLLATRCTKIEPVHSVIHYGVLCLFQPSYHRERTISAECPLIVSTLVPRLASSIYPMFSSGTGQNSPLCNFMKRNWKLIPTLFVSDRTELMSMAIMPAGR